MYAFLKKIKIIKVCFFILFAQFNAFGQGVAINEDGSPPDPSAGLDVNFSNKGILLPYVALSDVHTNVTSGNIEEGLLVNNINEPFYINGTGSYASRVKKDFYCWNGNEWQPLSGFSFVAWYTNGGVNGNGIYLNSGLGTLQDLNLILKRNNIQCGLIDSTNTSLGVKALLNNTIGINNSALGLESLMNNISGNGNVAAGALALKNNLDGDFNVAIGFESLLNNQNGSQNISVGSKALHENVIGDQNIALGYESMYSNYGGDLNIAIGNKALFLSSSASANIAIGDSALYNLNIGNSNIAIGRASLLNLNDGIYNTVLGASSCTNLIQGMNNCVYGDKSLVNCLNGNNNVIFGANSGIQVQTSNNILLGANTDVLNPQLNNQLNIANYIFGQNEKMRIGSKIGDIISHWKLLELMQLKSQLEHHQTVQIKQLKVLYVLIQQP